MRLEFCVGARPRKLSRPESSEFEPGLACGVRRAKVCQRRPSVGRRASSDEEMTEEVEEGGLSRSSSGSAEGSEVTVTDVLRPEGRRAASTRDVDPSSTRMTARCSGWEPGAAMSTAYSPGGSEGTRKVPRAAERMRMRRSWVGSVMTTSAAATGRPRESTMRPPIAPEVEVWARRGQEAERASRSSSVERRKRRAPRCDILVSLLGFVVAGLRVYGSLRGRDLGELGG